VEKLRWEIAERVPLRRLKTEVCEALRNRNWRSQRGHKKFVIWANERNAQAGEAGTAETVKQGSVHERAVGNADAPKGK
jgi:hypothetical protein